jgi:hypothetical protein
VRLVVADGFRPFLDERGTGPAQPLAEALRARGHEVDTIRIPAGGDDAQTALATRLTDVSDAGAMLLAVGPPAHLLVHPCKIVWCTGEDFSHGGDHPADHAGFDEARAVVADSPQAHGLVREWWPGTIELVAPLAASRTGAGSAKSVFSVLERLTA